MKKQPTIYFIPAFLIITVVLNSCLKDTGSKEYKVYTPILQTVDAVKASIKSEAPKPIVNAGKMVVIGNYLLVNEKNKGVHIIDNSNPSAPINKAFINIPANYDINIKGNSLYADCYTDLAVIDISNFNNISIKNWLPLVFKERLYFNGFQVDSGKIITDWNIKDTSINVEIKEGMGVWVNRSFIGTQLTFASATSNNSSSSSNSIAGSMSRLAIVNNYLYAVNYSYLKSYDISNPNNPVISSSIGIGWALETVFPFKNKLFIGSQTGMSIFDISNPSIPKYMSLFTHARLCDPVIADGNYAYITLHASESRCIGTTNEMDIVNITDLNNPTLTNKISLTHPNGLSKDGNVLVVCDDYAGLKIFDATNAQSPSLIKAISIPNAYDVICLSGVAIVSAADGIYEFDYSNINNIKQVSKISYN
ncbi:MAG: hypothetical protein JST07_03600 [Bacteroidetes bacterium]|nr:hypothetical protein [Bacteroidota bacterium]